MNILLKSCFRGFLVSFILSSALAAEGIARAFTRSPAFAMGLQILQKRMVKMGASALIAEALRMHFITKAEGLDDAEKFKPRKQLYRHYASQCGTVAKVCGFFWLWEFIS